MASFGIDFGTTNSAGVKWVADVEPLRFGDDAGSRSHQLLQ